MFYIRHSCTKLETLIYTREVETKFRFGCMNTPTSTAQGALYVLITSRLLN